MSGHRQGQQGTCNGQPMNPATRKKRRGMIEKKRRDKINESLYELKRLVPAAFDKQGSAKLEKAEILQMTVDYLKTLHSHGYGDVLTTSPKPNLAAHSADSLASSQEMQLEAGIHQQSMGHINQQQQAIQSQHQPIHSTPVDNTEPLAETQQQHVSVGSSLAPGQVDLLSDPSRGNSSSTSSSVAAAAAAAAAMSFSAASSVAALSPAGRHQQISPMGASHAMQHHSIYGQHHQMSAYHNHLTDFAGNHANATSHDHLHHHLAGHHQSESFAPHSQHQQHNHHHQTSTAVAAVAMRNSMKSEPLHHHHHQTALVIPHHHATSSLLNLDQNNPHQQHGNSLGAHYGTHHHSYHHHHSSMNPYLASMSAAASAVASTHLQQSNAAERATMYGVARDTSTSLAAAAAAVQSNQSLSQITGSSPEADPSGLQQVSSTSSPSGATSNATSNASTQRHYRVWGQELAY